MPREFNRSVMTNNGAMLLNRAQAGEALLEFTRMVIGDGTYTSEEMSIENMQKAENLKSPRQSYPIIEKSLEKERCLKLTSAFYNAAPGSEEPIIKEGFFVNEIGLFCREKDEDESEVLYSIVTVKDGPGDYMPAYNGENRAEIIQSWYTTITNDGVAYIKHTGGSFALAETVDKLSDKVNEIRELIFDSENELNISSSIIDFDDSGEDNEIESFADFMEKFVKGTSIYQLFSNLKTGLKYVLHAGQLVNNCATDNPDLPLASAQGKFLMDQITQLYSEINSQWEIKSLQLNSTYVQSGTIYFYISKRMIIIDGTYGITPKSNFPLNTNVAVLDFSDLIPEGYKPSNIRFLTLLFHGTNTASSDYTRIIGYARTNQRTILELEINSERILCAFGQIVIPLVPIS